MRILHILIYIKIHVNRISLHFMKIHLEEQNLPKDKAMNDAFTSIQCRRLSYFQCIRSQGNRKTTRHGDWNSLKRTVRSVCSI